MLDESFKRETNANMVEDSSRWDTAPGAGSGMRFTGTSTSMKVKVPGASAARVVHTTVPTRANQRAEVWYTGENSYSSTVLADSPVGYWRLGESTGPFADSSGNGLDGAAVGTPTRAVTGLIFSDTNKACKFAVSGAQRVDVPDNNLLDTPTAVTAEAWVKFDTTPSGSDRRWVLSKWLSPNSGWIIECAPSLGGWAARIQNGATAANVTFNGLIDANTHHVVLRADPSGDGKLRLYIDGVERGTAATWTTAMPNSNAAVSIGDWLGLFGVDGTVDEAAVYNSALSPTRILAHYNAGTVGGVATVAKIGVHCRYVDANNFVWAYVDQITTQKCYLVERVAGVDTTLATLDPESPATGKGAVRLEVVNRRARVWYESQASFVRDRPPDAAANLSGGPGSNSAPGGWGMYMEADQPGTAMRIVRFKARNLADFVPPAPYYTVANTASGTYDLAPITLSVTGQGGKETEWEVCPADADDFPEAIHHFTPSATTSVVLWVRPGYPYDCRARTINYDGSFGAWTDWQRVTSAGSKDAVVTPTLPSIAFPQTDFVNSFAMPHTQSTPVAAVVADNSRETRQAKWVRPRNGFKLTYQYRTRAEAKTLVDFFQEMRAAEQAFSWAHPQTGRQYAMRFASDELEYAPVSANSGGAIFSLSCDIEEVVVGGVATVSATAQLDPALYPGFPPPSELTSVPRPLSTGSAARGAPGMRGTTVVKPLT